MPAVQIMEPADQVVNSEQEYVATVMLDGRYIDDFTQHPEEVARSMGVEISPELAARLEATDESEIDLLRSTSRELIEQSTAQLDIISPIRNAWPIVIVGLAIGAIVVVDIATGETHCDPDADVVDTSPRAEDKL